jgi:Beta-lactamase class C and other penicillin binding proteins
LRAQTADRYQGTLEPWIERLLEREHRPGLAIAVVEGNRVVYAHGFGVKRLGKDDPITTRSLFHMASITKPFVATSLMQLVEKGKRRSRCAGRPLPAVLSPGGRALPDHHGAPDGDPFIRHAGRRRLRMGQAAVRRRVAGALRARPE